MSEDMTPGPLTASEVMALALQLSAITLPNGRKPFTVSIGDHTIHLVNEVGIATLAFRQAPAWKEAQVEKEQEAANKKSAQELYQKFRQALKEASPETWQKVQHLSEQWEEVSQEDQFFFLNACWEMNIHVSKEEKQISDEPQQSVRAQMTLQDIKKSRKITHEQMLAAIKSSKMHLHRLLRGRYKAIVDLTVWQVRDLAELFEMDYLAVIDAIKSSFDKSEEARSEEHIQMAHGLLDALRRRE